jgi:uncharacterized membrane protein YciS (DUF1049 family)
MGENLPQILTIINAVLWIIGFLFGFFIRSYFNRIEVTFNRVDSELKEISHKVDGLNINQAQHEIEIENIRERCEEHRRRDG